ncbi:hypothetical protein MKO06_15325 [Gramella sp. GC03-9]|uniref:Uncharacterized protein n=1 Tax=Christiangramia oceanisediminis TaxID=2920386 RepID=A0A9X2RDE3_9FLAO|nr:hypothetical protein [Gramella oceanisediminis]MCP9201280.1 hypothetical protein [Gramella oceanisediminis]
MYCFYLEKKQRLGFQKIHTKDCELLPEKKARFKLGYFDNYEELIDHAKNEYGDVKLCELCCNTEAES